MLRAMMFSFDVIALQSNFKLNVFDVDYLRKSAIYVIQYYVLFMRNCPSKQYK